MQESAWILMGMPLPAANSAKTLVRDDRKSQIFTLGTVSRRNPIAPGCLHPAVCNCRNS